MEYLAPIALIISIVRNALGALKDLCEIARRRKEKTKKDQNERS